MATAEGSSSDEEFYECCEMPENASELAAVDDIYVTKEQTLLEQSGSQVTTLHGDVYENTQSEAETPEVTGNLVKDGNGENVSFSPPDISAINLGQPSDSNEGVPHVSDSLNNEIPLSHENGYAENAALHSGDVPGTADDSAATQPPQDADGAAEDVSGQDFDGAAAAEGPEDSAKADQESSESSSDEELTEDELEERKTQAKEHKERGNELFKSGDYKEAEETYTTGLKVCPKCLKKDRSVLFSNRSACLMKLDKNEDAIKDCTKAINLHPTYLKAVLRRAQLYEKLEKFEEAQKDYETVLQMDPSIHSARAALLHLPEKIEERNEKLKKQMMSSLKDLGNLFLRPFGLSTDNFQMQQDPSSGSYNIQFNNNAGNNGPNGPRT